ncbi:hypothetical protein DFH07DRAFT_1055214 [Mycena maculata]|uniref:Uncharacterized protein n=1 Tax=Mycena maculata TaxID=230809 RepID=A0AAD7P085_9AGAR|nr:hypothetical protein DFH07DRAFT_1055214 [Mycena maculata]
MPIDPLTILGAVGSLYKVVAVTYHFGKRNATTGRLDAGKKHLHTGLDILSNAASGLPPNEAAAMVKNWELLYKQNYPDLREENPFSPFSLHGARGFHQKCSEFESSVRSRSLHVQLHKIVEQIIDEKQDINVVIEKKLAGIKKMLAEKASVTADTEATNTFVKSDGERSSCPSSQSQKTSTPKLAIMSPAGPGFNNRHDEVTDAEWILGPTCVATLLKCDLGFEEEEED